MKKAISLTTSSGDSLTILSTDILVVEAHGANYKVVYKDLDKNVKSAIVTDTLADIQAQAECLFEVDGVYLSVHHTEFVAGNSNGAVVGYLGKKHTTSDSKAEVVERINQLTSASDTALQESINDLSDVVDNAQLNDPTLTTFVNRVEVDLGAAESIQATFDRAEYLKGLGYVQLFQYYNLPSANSPSKIHAIKPINGDGDGTFTRASVANRTDEDGNVVSVSSGVSRVDYSNGYPEILLEPACTNLIVSPTAPTNQDITVTAQLYTLTFYGTGTIILSGTYSGSLVGTAASDRVTLTFTPTAGTLTLTISGTVTNAQLEARDHATTFVNGSRVAETLTVSNLDTNRIVSSGEGSLYFHLRWNPSIKRASSANTLAIRNSVSGDYFKISRVSTTGRNQLYKFFSGVATSIYTTLTDEVKVLIKWSGTTADVFVNGVKVVSSTAITSFTPDTLEILGTGNTIRISEIGVANSAISEDVARVLTSLTAEEDYLDIYPEDFGAVGDGTTDDAVALQEWADHVSAVNGSIGKTRGQKTYMTSATITFSPTATGMKVESPGLIKAISGSAISDVVVINVHSNTYVNIRADANDITDCTAVRFTNSSGGARPVLSGHAFNATNGVVLEDNIEGTELNVYADDCGKALWVREAGSPSETPDDVRINIIARDCDNAFTASDADGVSGTVNIHTEQGGTVPGTYVIDQSTGYFVYSGHVRGGQNMIKISGTAALAAFNNLTLHPITAVGLKVEIDASNCLVKGAIHIINSTNVVADGVWIKDCLEGSSLQLTMQESYNGYALKIGDAANSKQVVQFTLMPGSRIGSISSDQAVVLDYAFRCIIDAPYFRNGGVVIPDTTWARFNVVRLAVHSTPISITGSGADNMFTFITRLSSSDRSAILNPKRGYRIEAYDDGNVIKQSNYNSTAGAWE